MSSARGFSEYECFDAHCKQQGAHKHKVEVVHSRTSDTIEILIDEGEIRAEYFGDDQFAAIVEAYGNLV